MQNKIIKFIKGFDNRKRVNRALTMKTNFTFYPTKGIQNVYFPYLPTYLPNINISEYATANQ
jgi:hypothetical protein